MFQGPSARLCSKWLMLDWRFLWLDTHLSPVVSMEKVKTKRIFPFLAIVQQTPSSFILFS